MRYDFDHVPDRRGTDCLKYDGAVDRGKSPDLLPLWVADMDFPSCPAVVSALEERSRHGIFGYSLPSDDYVESLLNWFKNRLDWKPEPDSLVLAPGVVFALAAAIREFSSEGDAVLIQPPVYYPFAALVKANRRVLVENQLEYLEGRYQINLAAFEESVRTRNVKLFILCSPHNPVGRVWHPEELRAMGEICLRHNVLVISDEIHADFVYPGHRHQVFSALAPELASSSIICTSPGKSFNLAGLQIANIFIADSGLRRRFSRQIAASGYSQLNTLGLVSCEAAYRHGGPWFDALLSYIHANILYIIEYIQRHLPQLHVIRPEGTYLVWIDFRESGLKAAEMEAFIEIKARLWLSPGQAFGSGGRGFYRLNAACPRSMIKEAMERLAVAFGL